MLAWNGPSLDWFDIYWSLQLQKNPSGITNGNKVIV